MIAFSVEFEICELPKTVVGLRSPLIGGTEIDVGTLGVFAAFKMDCHSLNAILLVLISDHHCLFAEHHVADAVSVIANSFIAVEPLYFLEMLVLFVEIVASDTKSDSDENNNSGDGIYPCRDCSPYSTVDNVIHSVS